MFGELYKKYGPQITVNDNMKKVSFNLFGAKLSWDNSTVQKYSCTYVKDTLFIKINKFGLKIEF